MDASQVIKKLKSHANHKNVEGMARFGINPRNTLGVSMPLLRRTAKEIGKDHKLAQGLWISGIHEAKILASLIDDPNLVDSKQMERWVKGFDSWDVCDQTCMNLFDKTPFVYQKASKWAKEKSEFVRRAGFALMATLSVHDKKVKDKEFIKFFPLIKKFSTDERNFVRKANNWALRQIGKRNIFLNKKTIELAEEIQKINSKSAKWIAGDAIRELKAKRFK
ncbi:MAG: DNA alkylation repair protein [Candidatus Nealsonbacteria bacterium]|nr:DNA alkylation repair protein [Candidatus Nealsonbacteria bacterium]